MVIEKIIACTYCKKKVDFADSRYFCKECDRSFKNINGRPLFYISETDKNSLDELIRCAKSLQHRNEVSSEQNPDFSNFKTIFFQEFFPQATPNFPHWNFYFKKAKKMLEEIKPGSLVLDIGAGECKYESVLSSVEYLSMDLVFSSDKHDFSKIDIIADASAIPIIDGVFDYALSLVVFEHVPDPDLAIKEMSRILKKGGKAHALIPLVRPEHLQPYDFHRFTRFGIKRLFDKNGLKILSIEESNGALWTSVHYLMIAAKTHSLTKYGRKSIRGILYYIFWTVILYPLQLYARLTDSHYPKDFPMYFWVCAEKG